MAATPRLALLAGALIALGCDPNIERDPPVQGTSSVFNPFTGQIPLPNDALIDFETNSLTVPIEPADSELTKHIKAGLNDLDGWIPASTITIPFDGLLDKATVNGDTVRLYDVTGGTATRIPGDSYFVAFNVGRAPATEPPYTLYVRLKPPSAFATPPDFGFGHRYLVVVTDAVRDIDGKPVLGTTLMELLKSRTPLANEFGRSRTILPDADAVVLERTRAASYAPAFDAMEATEPDLRRESLVAHAAFRIQSNPRPVFEPIPTPKLPSPMDRTSGAANAETTAHPEVLFDVAYDPASAEAGTKLFERNGTLTEVDADLETTTSANEDGKFPLVIVPKAPLEPSTTYQVVLTSAITSPDGVPSRPGSYFALVSAPVPLLDTSTDPPTLESPYIDSTLDTLIFFGGDPTADDADWEGAYKNMTGSLALGTLEAYRSMYQPFIDDAVAAGIARESITVLWTFTTADQ